MGRGAPGGQRRHLRAHARLRRQMVPRGRASGGPELPGISGVLCHAGILRRVAGLPRCGRGAPGPGRQGVQGRSAPGGCRFGTGLLQDQRAGVRETGAHGRRPTPDGLRSAGYRAAQPFPLPGQSAARPAQLGAHARRLPRNGEAALPGTAEELPAHRRGAKGGGRGQRGHPLLGGGVLGQPDGRPAGAPNKGGERIGARAVLRAKPLSFPRRTRGGGAAPHADNERGAARLDSRPGRARAPA